MRGAAALVGIVLLVASGCRHSSAGAATTISDSENHSTLSESLDSACGHCHDSEERPPVLGGGAPSPTVALQAALMLSAARMPPPPRAMKESDRNRLIKQLCVVGAKDAQTCARSLTWTKSSSTLRDPTEFLRVVASRLPAPMMENTHAEKLLRRYIDPDQRIVVSTATLALLTALLAADVCTSGTAANPEPSFERCARVVLDQDAWEIPDTLSGGRLDEPGGGGN